MRFIVVGDMHYPYPNASSTDTPGVDDRTGPPTQPTAWQDRFDLLLEALEVERDTGGLDFVVLNGDIIHSDVSDRASALGAIKTAINDLGLTVYAGYGNHDRANDSTWQSVWGHSRTHAWEIGNYGFVILNSSDTSGSRQVCLDDTALATAFQEYADKDAVFVFSHIPRYSGIRPGTQYDSPQCDTILGLFEAQENLAGVFHSHFHEEDRVFVRNGVHYCFTGHVAHYGLNYYGYRLVEVLGNGDIVTIQKTLDGATRYEPYFLRKVSPTPTPAGVELHARYLGQPVQVEAVYANVGGDPVEVEIEVLVTQ